MLEGALRGLGFENGVGDGEGNGVGDADEHVEDLARRVRVLEKKGG